MSITERIFVELSQKSISQKDFAKKIGVNEKTVSAWKNNNSLPPADKLPIISEVLGLSLDYLITGQEKSQCASDGYMTAEQYKKGQDSSAVDSKRATNVLGRVVSLIAEKFESDEAFEIAAELPSGTVSNIRRGGRRGKECFMESFYKMAKALNVTTDYILGLSPRNDPRLDINENMTVHDRLLCCAKHSVGRDNALLMFQAAGIPIEDRNYTISNAQNEWIVAHCGIDTSLITGLTEISLIYFEDEEPALRYGVFFLEDQLTNSTKAEYERRYVKLKLDSAVAAAKKIEEMSLESYNSDITHGFLSLIKQFEGNLGAQYALLDRCRKARDELVNDMHQWQDSETAVLKELA